MIYLPVEKAEREPGGMSTGPSLDIKEYYECVKLPLANTIYKPSGTVMLK